jgi:hypothetical protein
VQVHHREFGAVLAQERHGVHGRLRRLDREVDALRVGEAARVGEVDPGVDRVGRAVEHETGRATGPAARPAAAGGQQGPEGRDQQSGTHHRPAS